MREGVFLTPPFALKKCRLRTRNLPQCLHSQTQPYTRYIVYPSTWYRSQVSLGGSNQQARDGSECGKKQIDDKCVGSLIEETERKTPFDKPKRRWKDGRHTKANIREM